MLVGVPKQLRQFRRAFRYIADSLRGKLLRSKVMIYARMVTIKKEINPVVRLGLGVRGEPISWHPAIVREKRTKRRGENGKGVDGQGGIQIQLHPLNFKH